MDNRAKPYNWINKWMRRLRLNQRISWKLAKVDRDAVINEKGVRGHDFVGVIFDTGTSPHEIEVTIAHTRELTEDDVLHELLHVAHPKWNEKQIEEETWRLLLKSKGLVK